MDQNKNKNAVEIWGGVEYSLVRVRDSVYDQLLMNGHEERTGDPDLFGDLGIKKIRYPLLWEKYYGHEREFFNFHDRRLEKLSSLGIEPIAGLLHHGSGPFFTGLYEKDFPEHLAEYSAGIASRYPWIGSYTPVNEPLTTARFSGLYGFWYPHRRDDRSFVRIFLNQLKGIILSMKAIRSINPDAGLIQTEDICRIHSSEELSYQAGFENLRRWLTCDFLLGKVDELHPMYRYFIEQGVSDKELSFFIENPVEPDICGFNYYVTSERYLDHRKELYPSCFHGGNGIHEYADIEAVRANIPGTISSFSLMKEAWERYHLPLAFTEIHLACTREEQLRWFNEAWQTGNLLREQGIDFRAITAWSFFGSFDWSSLLCEKRNDYEPGVFDIRSGKPRPTALAGLIRSLNNKQNSFNQLTIIPGWWKRKDRFIFKPENEELKIDIDSTENPDVSRILITGASGSLGRAFARICGERGIPFILTGREEMDIASEESVNRLIEKIRPWALINAAGFTRIDEAENAAYSCFRENTIGPGILAEACRSAGIKFVTFSADQVFNGSKKKPYEEQDHTNPLNLYGLSKKIAEEKVMRINPDSLIIRSSYFFNPWNGKDTLSKILIAGMNSEGTMNLPSDIIMSPVYIPHLVNTVLDLIIDGESGIWHMSNQEEISYYDLALTTLRIAGLKESSVSPVPSRKLRYTATRPRYSVLRSSSGIILPGLASAIENFLYEFSKEPFAQIITQTI